MKTLAFTAACAALLGCFNFAVAQDAIRLPDLGGAVVLDGGAFFEAGDFSGRHGGMSVSKSVRNGVTTINARSDGERCEIVDDPDNGITVKLTQRYGPDQAEEIAEEFPGLYMHLKSIPSNVDGAEVDVHVDVTRTFEAADKEELQEQHPMAFEAYEKYSQSANGIPGRLGGFGGLALPDVDFDIIEGDMAEIEEMQAKVREALKDRVDLRMPAVGGLSRIRIIEVESDSDTDKEAESDKQEQQQEAGNKQSSEQKQDKKDDQ